MQYFERSRFEYHPEHQGRYRVLLGRLGGEALERERAGITAFPPARVPDYGGPPPPPPAPAPQPTPPPSAQGSATVSPASGPVGTSFTATFSNLGAHSTVAVMVGADTDGPQWLVGRLFPVGADGSLQVPLDDHRLPVGRYLVIAVDGRTVVARGKFAVTASEMAHHEDAIIAAVLHYDGGANGAGVLDFGGRPVLSGHFAVYRAGRPAVTASGARTSIGAFGELIIWSGRPQSRGLLPG